MLILSIPSLPMLPSFSFSSENFHLLIIKINITTRYSAWVEVWHNSCTNKIINPNQESIYLVCKMYNHTFKYNWISSRTNSCENWLAATKDYGFMLKLEWCYQSQHLENALIMDGLRLFMNCPYNRIRKDTKQLVLSMTNFE